MDETYFKRNKPALQSVDIHIFINQAGYQPKSIKKAVITKQADKFYLVNELGIICYEGNISYFGLDLQSQDQIYIADFSEFEDEGNYRVAISEDEFSFPFDIKRGIYHNVLHDTMKAYYYLRCGCELEEAYAGKFTHKKCHHNEAVLWEDKNKALDVSGGWHDAGDYGRYVTAGACALGHILYAYQLFPKALHSLTLNIPKSNGSLPDILEECRYELEWLLKMQREDGAVYHKATTALHAPFVMPEEDQEQMYVFSVSSMATADFTAICALAYRIYKPFDLEFANVLLNASKTSFEWLMTHPEFLGFRNPKGTNTGEYGESSDVDNRFWAVAELFAATGEERYHDCLKEALKKKFSFTDLGYFSIGGLGSLAYILCGHSSCDSVILGMLKSSFITRAELLKKVAEDSGYGVAMLTVQYCWGSNMQLLMNGMTFVLADLFEGGQRFASYAAAQVHYLLGVNALGISYVTGTGVYSCNNPHLRPAYADGIEECMPGMVSGGPNRHPADEDATILIPKGTPPMKCFADDVGCYSLNEITIYWNSPAVFLLAYLESIELSVD